jgi:hypothetical protein
MNEYFSPGGIYTVNSVGLIADGGGIGNTGVLGAITNNGSGFDPLSPQTAYLYNTFLNNPSALTGYTGTDAQQKSLQIAFWYLENEIASVNGDSMAQGYVEYALGYTGGDFFGVAVFNPVTFDSTGKIIARNQSMLYQSVPEAGSLLLFGTGLVGLVVYRRKQRMR